MSDPCPCCSGRLYDECCRPFIEGNQLPLTPEQLMRSRYTAYAQANIHYIQQTMREPAARGYDPVEAKHWALRVKWKRLKVLQATQIGDRGTVEFVAVYIDQGKSQRLQEHSIFQRIDGRWYYVDRIVDSSA